MQDGLEVLGLLVEVGEESGVGGGGLEGALAERNSGGVGEVEPEVNEAGDCAVEFTSAVGDLVPHSAEDGGEFVGFEGNAIGSGEAGGEKANVHVGCCS